MKPTASNAKQLQRSCHEPPPVAYLYFVRPKILQASVTERLSAGLIGEVIARRVSAGKHFVLITSCEAKASGWSVSQQVKNSEPGESDKSLKSSGPKIYFQPRNVSPADLRRYRILGRNCFQPGSGLLDQSPVRSEIERRIDGRLLPIRPPSPGYSSSCRRSTRSTN